jgi:hypothetical protein
MRQWRPEDPEVVTAVVVVPADLVASQNDYPYRVVDAVKAKFCAKFAEFTNARWWFETAPVLQMEYGGELS